MPLFLVPTQGQAPISGASVRETDSSEPYPIDDETFRILVSQADTPSGPLTAIVGHTLEDTAHAIQVTVGALAVGMPLLVLLAAAMTWLLVGRVLRPVEAIRSEVAEIGSSDLHRRVPQPETADEIGRLARTMNHMLDRLEAGSIRQRRFVPTRHRAAYSNRHDPPRTRSRAQRLYFNRLARRRGQCSRRR